MDDLLSRVALLEEKTEQLEMSQRDASKKTKILVYALMEHIETENQEKKRSIAISVMLTLLSGLFIGILIRLVI